MKKKKKKVLLKPEDFKDWKLPEERTTDIQGGQKGELPNGLKFEIWTANKAQQ